MEALAAKGLTGREIARELGITPQNVASVRATLARWKREQEKAANAAEEGTN
ncbi:hypothetical protein [Leucobacter muris]|uniref:hypothetical protein n=1 Tax=Leucobacter muris TaxID=1935379 RepID=UPI0013E3BA15|nr:hypothetical protein [Leucobacter muris]